ncbi:complement decay-accelerating factor-like [Trichosurus vulpecula]|uniref:complement decay-accelerating factor-like n=1 Tax=Trichosurus vulpecula TaxID=9337 RepID=UPI00186AF0BF|nr:complement decay-accelerating factor-like [Trichosurus vulpecula]
MSPTPLPQRPCLFPTPALDSATPGTPSLGPTLGPPSFGEGLGTLAAYSSSKEELPETRDLRGHFPPLSIPGAQGEPPPNLAAVPGSVHVMSPASPNAPPTLGLLGLLSLLLSLQCLPAAHGACSIPPDIPNAKPELHGLTSFPVDSTVTYKCKEGFVKIPGKSDSVVCLQSNKWSKLSEFCNRTCNVPPSLRFASLKKQSSKQNYFPVGFNVQYECRQGYKRDNSLPAMLTCLENLRWSNASEFCKRKSCPPPAKLLHGHVSVKTDILLGSIITFACDKGYRLVGEQESQCILKDKNVDWSDPHPKCTEITTLAPTTEKSTKAPATPAPPTEQTHATKAPATPAPPTEQTHATKAPATPAPPTEQTHATKAPATPAPPTEQTHATKAPATPAPPTEQTHATKAPATPAPPTEQASTTTPPATPVPPTEQASTINTPTTPAPLTEQASATNPPTTPATPTEQASAINTAKEQAPLTEHINATKVPATPAPTREQANTINAPTTPKEQASATTPPVTPAPPVTEWANATNAPAKQAQPPTQQASTTNAATISTTPTTKRATTTRSSTRIVTTHRSTTTTSFHTTRSSSTKFRGKGTTPSGQ